MERAVRDAGDTLKMAEIKRQQKENAPREGGAFADAFDVAARAATEALKSVDAAVALAPAVPDLATLKAEALRFMDGRDDALALLKGKKATNARRACVEIRLYFDAGNLSACLESAAEMKDVLDAIPDFAGAPRAPAGEDGGREPRKTRSTPLPSSTTSSLRN